LELARAYIGVANSKLKIIPGFYNYGFREYATPDGVLNIQSQHVFYRYTTPDGVQELELYKQFI
jgi:hypothetical protein